ncbi:DUF488 family protein [Nocardia neocaledoniensis]|uniref:DUF488 domain-containing protein n=1 Tax=Nocardia neocaledoniensis TaxID=236511 RepID=UPI002455B9CC|nr:DUF488 domain-containing protein [Nocardia neocaledoniensis]
MLTVYTIGHSTRTADEFLALLHAYGVTQLADIRTVPRSRHNPQFGREILPATLHQAGIDYVYLAALGGLRHGTPSDRNAGWRNASFHAYADYMQTPEFAAGITELMELAGAATMAIMCAEAVPWRCHRSLVGDALLVRGVRVRDIMSATRAPEHQLTSFARVDGTTITYPADS